MSRITNLVFSRVPDDRETLQPVLGIIFDNHRTLADLPSAQPLLFDFRIGRGSADTVRLAELSQAHSPVQSAAL